MKRCKCCCNSNSFHINRKLLPTKVFVFFYYGGLVLLTSNIQSHFDSIGVSASQKSLLDQVYPWISLLGGLITGIISDRTGHYKYVLFFCVSFTILLSIILLNAIPYYGAKHNSTEEAILLMRLQGTVLCSENRRLESFSSEESLNFSSKCAIFFQTDLALPVVTFTECWSSCTIDSAQLQIDNPHITLTRHNDSLLIAGSLIGDGKFSNVEFQFVSDRKLDFPVWLVAGVCANTTTKLLALCETSRGNVSWNNCSVNYFPNLDLPLQCYEEVLEGNQELTFGTYFTIRLLLEMTIHAGICTVDASLLYMTEKHKGDLGKTRAFNGAATAVVPLASDQLFILFNNVYPEWKNYSFAIYFATILMMLSMIALFFNDMPTRRPASDMWTSVAKNPKMIGFVILVFFLGMCSGLHESILPLYLNIVSGLNATYLMLATIVIAITATILHAVSTFLINKLGHTTVLLQVVFIIGLQFLVFAYMFDGLGVAVAMFLNAFFGKSGFEWTVIILYSAKLAPEYLATIQGLLTGLHHGIGKGLGQLFGDYMGEKFEIREALKIFSYISLAYATLHFIVHLTYSLLNKRWKNVEITHN